MSVFNVDIFYPPLALCWGRWSWSGAFFEQDGNSVSIDSFCENVPTIFPDVDLDLVLIS